MSSALSSAPRRLTAAAAVVAFLSPVMAQHTAFSTHDWTLSPGGVSSGGVLDAPSGWVIGEAGEGKHTLARDVSVGHDVIGTGSHMIYVVGSIDHAGLGSLGQAPSAGWGQAQFGGSRDGFVVAISADLAPFAHGYWGGSGDDGLTGVNNWNEFSEHLTVVGFTQGAGNYDIGVQSYYFNDSYGPPPDGNFTGPQHLTQQLHPIRSAVFGGVGDDRPAMMGSKNASTMGLPFDTQGLGEAAGGGVAVGNDGRCNVVGRTNPSTGGYPVVGGRGPDLGADAVRTVVDLVPAASPAPLGVGRTDGTGFQASPPAFPPAPSSGLTGGTTPTCALAPYGRRIGEPTPALPRVHLDYEGGLGAGATNAAILVTRPAGSTDGIAAGVLQFGLPPAAPWVVFGGAEIWLGDPNAGFTVFPEVAQPARCFRLPLLTLTNSPLSVSAQYIGLLLTPVSAGPGCSLEWVASPALWFTY